VIYGRNAVVETIRGKREIFRLIVATGIREDERIQEILEESRRRVIEIERVERETLDFLTNTTHHQGIALVVGPYPYADLEDIADRPGTVLILDHVQDPQNFGTLLRTAEATGVTGVIMPQDRTVAVTPAVVNTSSGAVEHQEIARVPNLVRAIEVLKSHGWWIAGLAGAETGQNIFEDTIPTPVALVVGGEGGGISPLVAKNCDILLSIPMVGRIASLNASTAGAIALYEVFRRSHNSPQTVD
jgi:23S rRNA (guanosine2251-2'-O)-methyltransferase